MSRSKSQNGVSNGGEAVIAITRDNTGLGLGTLGLTKREHFAGVALQGLLASMSPSHDGDARSAMVRLKHLTITAVAAADSLLASLEEIEP
jgi:hypothetical protein